MHMILILVLLFILALIKIATTLEFDKSEEMKIRLYNIIKHKTLQFLFKVLRDLKYSDIGFITT